MPTKTKAPTSTRDHPVRQERRQWYDRVHLSPSTMHHLVRQRRRQWKELVQMPTPKKMKGADCYLAH